MVATMKEHWTIHELQRIEWSIGDGWFEREPGDFPNLSSATTALQLLRGVHQYVTFAETSVTHRGDVSGLGVEISDDGALRVVGDWKGPVLPVVDERSFPELEREELDLSEADSPFESLTTARKPVTGTLEGDAGTAILVREDEVCWSVVWDVGDDLLKLHRIDGDLTWTHGETTPGGVWWRGTFRPA